MAHRIYSCESLTLQKNACCYGEGGRQAVANPQETTTTPTMTGLWRGGVDGLSFVISLEMPDLQHNYYGAPSILWINATMAPDGNSVSLDVQVRVMFNRSLGIFVRNE